VSLFRYGPGKVATGGGITGSRRSLCSRPRVGRIRLDDEVVELKGFDVVRVAPHVVGAFAADADGLEIIAVGGAQAPRAATFLRLRPLAGRVVRPMEAPGRGEPWGV
jgi:hypothetical protein